MSDLTRRNGLGQADTDSCSVPGSSPPTYADAILTFILAVVPDLFVGAVKGIQQYVRKGEVKHGERRPPTVVDAHGRTAA